MKPATQWAQDAINRALEEKAGMPVTLLVARIGIRVAEAIEGAAQEAVAADRERARALVGRALDAVRDHDFPKGHRYDVLCEELIAHLDGRAPRPGRQVAIRARREKSGEVVVYVEAPGTDPGRGVPVREGKTWHPEPYDVANLPGLFGIINEVGLPAGPDSQKSSSGA